MDASYLSFLGTNDFRCVFRYYYDVNANTGFCIPKLAVDVSYLKHAADVILDVFTWPSLAINVNSVLMSLYTAHIMDPIQSSLILVKTVCMYSK